MWRTELCIVLCLCCVLWAQSSGAESNCDRKEKSSASLEIAEILIKKTKEIIPDCPETVRNKSECGAKAKMTAYLDIAEKLITNTRDKYPTCIDDETKDRIPNNRDCSELMRNGHNSSGVYTIWLEGSSLKNKTLQVFCEMDGGGWTVIQRRGNFTPQEDFYRDWKDYKYGFGRITKDFWIGNDNLFEFLKQPKYSIKFDLEDVSGNKTYAVYDTVWMEDEVSNYKLHIHGYSGTAGNSMEDSNNAYFSTKDRDNDKWSGHCARDFHQGGWWHSGCGFCNLNGPYRPGVTGTMYWHHWQELVGLAATEIKLKRKYE